MAALIDPTTGLPLPADAIQRMLFVAAKVHVYQIPPLTSTKGYTAASWTTDPQRHIFTARLRVLETGTDSDEEAGNKTEDQPEKVKVDIVLEDPSTGQLFAAAPYTAADVVEAALDSARFYALRVQDPQGRKAMLGIGFEERPESFDFSVTLQEARKTIGLDGGRADAGATGGGAAASAGSSQLQKKDDAAAKRDYSLKDGETITVNLSSSKFGRRAAAGSSSSSSTTTSSNSGGFSLPPPPPPPSSSLSSSSSSPASSFSLPPPPPPNRRAAARRSVGDPSILGFNLQQQQQQHQQQHKKTAADLGFDDGQFDEFA